MIKNLLLVMALAFGLASTAEAQIACPAFSQGAVLTAGQWQACFDSKQNALGYTPLNIAGGTMTGFLGTVASATGSAGFNLPPGVAPTSPNDGDLWTTTSGVFARINGSTIQLAVSGGAGSFSSVAIDGSGSGASIQNNSGAIIAIRNTANNADAALSALSFSFGAQGGLSSPSDGIITLLNNAGTDFTRLQFGGTTSAFPAIKRSSAAFDFRLADDSGYARIAASNVFIQNAIAFNAGAGTTIIQTADGSLQFQNSAGSDFGLLQLGGTTSSFPAIKKSGANLQFRLADDSAFASIFTSTISATGPVVAYFQTAPAAGGALGVGLEFSATSNFGIFFGSGVPTLSAAQGSLYLRTDGSSTSTRTYVNTNGSTGWTNLTSGS